MMPGFWFLNAASTSELGRSRNRRERTTYTRKQLDILEQVFRHETHYPDVFKREELSKILTIGETKIQIWFKNRRARHRQSKRMPKGLSKDSGFGSEDGGSKDSIPSSPSLPTSSSRGSSSSQSLSISMSPSLPIPKPEVEEEFKPFEAPEPMKDFEKSFYSFWPTSNWQNPPYYPVVSYPQTYVPPMASNPAAFYGYPQPTAMPSQYPNFYPQASFSNPYFEVDAPKAPE